MSWSAAFQERNRVERRDLAPFTSFRIGGPAEIVTLEAREDLPELLAARPRFIGRGANLLIGDRGVDEPVAHLGSAFDFCEIDADEGIVRAGAAHDLAKLIGACARAGLAGPEGLAGVPATVGGALAMNAGTATTWTWDHVARAEVVLPGEDAPRWLERGEVPAAYRDSGLPPGTLFLGCELRLGRGDPEELQRIAGRLKRAKADSQPLTRRSAGCIFKNPSPELPAGRLVEELGFKGGREGGAEISTIHANFIVNTGDATAADVIALIDAVRARALAERGVRLAVEVRCWNCAPAPLEAEARR